MIPEPDVIFLGLLISIVIVVISTLLRFCFCVEYGGIRLTGFRWRETYRVEAIHNFRHFWANQNYSRVGLPYGVSIDFENRASSLFFICYDLT